MTRVTRYGLRLGTPLHLAPERQRVHIQALVLPVPTWRPIDTGTSGRAATIAAMKRRKDRPVNAVDPFIAATALELNIPVVTRNLRHFEAIDGLVVENWFVET